MKHIFLTLSAILFASHLVSAQSKINFQAGDSINSYKSVATDRIVFNPDLTYGEVTDADGNIYKTVTIGTQTWMAENLKTTKFNDSTAISDVTGGTAWVTLTSPAYCWYNNDAAANKVAYGALYNWYAASSGKLSPKGWHVPTDTEWAKLETYLIDNGYNYDGTLTGDKYAKALASASGWPLSTNTGAVGNTDYSAKRNATGFTVLPGGYLDDEGLFTNLGTDSYIWSSSANFGNYAYGRGLNYNYWLVYRYGYYKNCGFSVRCVKDSVSTTEVKPLDRKAGCNLAIYPNPVNNELHISFEALKAGDIQAEIIDLHGKLLHQQTTNSQCGTNRATISVLQLPTGMYLFRLQSSNKSETIKFYKK